MKSLLTTPACRLPSETGQAGIDTDFHGYNDKASQRHSGSLSVRLSLRPA
ncbi:MAG: hypothetical protein V3U73_00325 [bacterium]